MTRLAIARFAAALPIAKNAFPMLRDGVRRATRRGLFAAGVAVALSAALRAHADPDPVVSFFAGADRVRVLLSSSEESSVIDGIRRAEADLELLKAPCADELGCRHARLRLRQVLLLLDSGFRAHPRVVLAFVRAVGPLAFEREVAQALVRVGSMAVDAGLAEADRSRLLLAKAIALHALASFGGPNAKALLDHFSELGPREAVSSAIGSNPDWLVLAPVLSPALVRSLFADGDLRALAQLRALVAENREDALLALADLGDQTVEATALVWLDGNVVSRRLAAARALLRLDSPAAESALERLLDDPSLAPLVIALPFGARCGKCVAALEAPASSPKASAQDRERWVNALARSRRAPDLKRLASLLSEPSFSPWASAAWAKFVESGRGVELLGAQCRSGSRAALRVFVSRRFERGEANNACEKALSGAVASNDVGMRQLVAWAEGLEGGVRFVRDRDERVRRVGFVGLYAHPGAASFFENELARPQSGDTVALIAAHLVLVGADRALADSYFDRRLRSGGSDRGLALEIVTRRARELPNLSRVEAALPHERFAMVRGIAANESSSAVGLLAQLYEDESDARVREAIVRELLSGRDVPASRRALALARALDPDARVRSLARRGASDLLANEPSSELAWIHVRASQGAAPASLVRGDGRVVPIAFDEDGFAVVPVPSGPVRLQFEFER